MSDTEARNLSKFNSMHKYIMYNIDKPWVMAIHSVTIWSYDTEQRDLQLALNVPVIAVPREQNLSTWQPAWVYDQL